MDFFALVLAGGINSRFKNHFFSSKVLVPVLGKAIIEYSIDALRQNNINEIYVIANEENYQAIDSLLHNKIFGIIKQDKNEGTGSVFFLTKEILRKNIEKRCLIINGDSIIYGADIVRRIKEASFDCDLTFLTEKSKQSKQYGVVRRKNNQVIQIQENNRLITFFREQCDVDKEYNLGFYSFDVSFLLTNINALKKHENEYYLTDLINRAYTNKINTIGLEKNEFFNGVNTLEELLDCTLKLQRIIAQSWIQKGVLLLGQNIEISADSQIEQDVVIEDNVHVLGKAHIGSHTRIMSHSIIIDSNLGQNCVVGPFAYMRPENNVKGFSKIGSFVEIKKSEVGKNTKIPHLSYVGNAILGDDINVGAGTIFANYNGSIKQTITIGNNSFIGSNNTLIAPLEIGCNCLLAGGSTITQNVEDNILVFGRSKQVNKKR